MPLEDVDRPMSLEDLLRENGVDPQRAKTAINRGHGGGISPEDNVLPPTSVKVETADDSERGD